MFAAPVVGAFVCTGWYLPQNDSINELIIWKNESFSRFPNWCQI